MSCGRMPDNMMLEENYNSSAPVCDNQQDFNVAFRKALKHNMKEDVKKMGVWLYIYMILWLVFFVWALCIAMKVAPSGPDRTLHLVFAMVFSPIYVIAYYLGMMQSGSGMMFGMCGGGNRY